ncbi:hypothetical protein [Pseudanabaena sp. PCC 6802]|uniref:hypothetical protein n=1 Tax=Pseudanabaena sp. PCC 6802 TaxID=118173 RepID=UPI0003489673|nr:hypothetical protein [Pseudanabaena sp. PCC 6802]
MTSVQAQPVLVQPNQFILSGYGIGVTYETTSFTGTPRFSFTRGSQTLNFVGEEIHVEQTQLGQMVTVNLSGNQKAVGTVETLTLLVPAITVPATTKSAPMNTIAIFSTRSTLVKTVGQSQTYMSVSLSGTANQIDF